MNYIKKIKVFLFLFITLIFILCLYINFSNTNSYDVNEIVNSRILQKNIVTNIKINGILGCFDKKEDKIYYSAESFNYKNIKIFSPYSVKFSISKIDEKHYNIFVFSKKYYYKYEIVLVDIPLINIFSFQEFNSEKCNIESSKCSIGITISDYKNNNGPYNILNSQGMINVRGVTSRYFEKKSYKISIDKKTNILGLLNDNDWILDALYSDPSKIRNKLSSDIWNEMNDNQSVNNDLKVEFVEVFFDNEYKGLYTIKNNVDKHVTALSESGLLIKALNHFNHDYIELLDKEKIIIGEDNTFLNMEIKKYNSNLFDIFCSKMKNYYLDNQIFDAFDEQNYLNYKIFISLIAGYDNITKNLYYSMDYPDKKIFITPWDMDMTWELFFDSDSILFSNKNTDDYNEQMRLETIFLNDLSDEANLKIKQRYWELRDTVITNENINSYLESYKDILVNSGAADRDSDLWYEYDVEKEIYEVQQWAKNRISFLDNYFKIN